MVAAANPSASSTRDLRHFNFGSSDPVLKVHEPPTSQKDSFPLQKINHHAKTAIITSKLGILLP